MVFRCLPDLRKKSEPQNPPFILGCKQHVKCNPRLGWDTSHWHYGTNDVRWGYLLLGCAFHKKPGALVRFDPCASERRKRMKHLRCRCLFFCFGLMSWTVFISLHIVLLLVSVYSEVLFGSGGGVGIHTAVPPLFGVGGRSLDGCWQEEERSKEWWIYGKAANNIFWMEHVYNIYVYIYYVSMKYIL